MRTRDLKSGNAPTLTPLHPGSPLHAAAFRGFERRIAAFTLIEVMIACGIFFMATFAILALVAGTLRNARALQRGDVDAGMAASQIFQMLKTNRQADISGSGDFGDTYPDFSYEFSSSEYMTNGLLQVDIVVNKRGLQKPFDTLSIWVYSPDAKSGPGGLNLH
ncbi:MAG TPA: hypothetical protein VG167_02045 [Verrucomicrobiae bacterium]|nr:hypothetical protein [Verrucomicrobiae bacterium]